MLTQNHTQEAQTLLKASDHAFDEGDLREGARLLWEATKIGVASVARKLDMPCDTYDDIKQVIYRLDGIDEKGRFEGYPHYSAKFGVARGFKEHAETDEWELPEFEWEPDEYHMYRPSVKKFVAMLAAFAEDIDLAEREQAD